MNSYEVSDNKVLVCTGSNKARALLFVTPEETISVAEPCRASGQEPEKPQWLQQS